MGLKPPKGPRCEACGEETAWVLSYDRDFGWRLTGNCTITSEDYDLTFEDYLTNRPHELPYDWLTHLRAKNWFNEADFLAAVRRMNEARDAKTDDLA